MQILMIAGTVGKDATLRTTQGGDDVLSFSVAVDNGKDKDGNRRDATWYDASMWGKRARSLRDHIVKGTKLTLTGRPTARAHEGKVYLGISVDDLVLQGGAPQRDTPREQPSGMGAGGRQSVNDMDEEIPF